MVFWGVKFWSRDFFVGSPRVFLGGGGGGVDLCNRSIIPDT